MTATLQERFQIQVEEHKGILYKVCNSYCRNPADRDDLAQEIAVQLWRSFERFDGRCRFSTWMYRIALNVAISFYRRESTRTRHVLPADERFLESIDESANRLGANRLGANQPGANRPEEIALLYQFIDALEPLNKALNLLYLDDNSYLDIAEVLGITETNVATKISRLKKTMRQEFRGAEQKRKP